jgi:hypothetical protein
VPRGVTPPPRKFQEPPGGDRILSEDELSYRLGGISRRQIKRLLDERKLGFRKDKGRNAKRQPRESDVTRYLNSEPPVFTTLNGRR